ncbi:c-type cytochrome [Pinirhizobacter soli]|uniref:c-type cytochrome n=1 Tax=Pinirhizobacter soli TaxID=2786953 RepID=UPI002029CBC0|nr:cytochrome c [Pinirhizobacter soli]
MRASNIAFRAALALGMVLAGFAVAHADPASVERGRYLATAGDCASCHTALNGAPFAGGRVVGTPFGGIPTPNITFDRATGIGAWTKDEFYLAMHEGVSRDGTLLYPAFPFTSYTRMTRADVDAVYDFLGTVARVSRKNDEPQLSWPYSMRSLMSAWRLLYFDKGEYVPDPSKSAAWNRGAYLVQGPGHCNDCHTARNSLGATVSSPRLAGGLIPVQDWYASDLSMAKGGGLANFRQQDIVDLLKTGRSARGTAFGPMAEVVQMSTQYLSDDDLAAIATYLQSLPPRPAPDQGNDIDASASMARGQKIYADSCADCHGVSGTGVAGVYPPLDANSSVAEPVGVNAIRIVLSGGFAPVTAGNRRPYSMPPFAQKLSDQEVADVTTYIRRSWGNNAPPVQIDDVRKYRSTPTY